MNSFVNTYFHIIFLCSSLIAIHVLETYNFDPPPQKKNWRWSFFFCGGGEGAAHISFPYSLSHSNGCKCVQNGTVQRIITLFKCSIHIFTLHVDQWHKTTEGVGGLSSKSIHIILQGIMFHPWLCMSKSSYLLSYMFFSRGPHMLASRVHSECP